MPEDSKPFAKLTAKEHRDLLADYAEQRDIQWPPVDDEGEPREATYKDARELIDLDLPAYLKVLRDGPWIDGKHVTDSQLTFNEQKALKALIKEHSDEDDESGDDAPPRVYWPALVTIVKQRKDDDYSFETAGDLSYEDLVKPDAPDA